MKIKAIKWRKLKKKLLLRRMSLSLSMIKLSCADHQAEKVNKANKLVGLIRRTFVALDAEIFKVLFKSLVRSHVEYANQVWSPHLVKDIEMVENVQRRATRMVPELKGLNYEERLTRYSLENMMMYVVKEY